MKKVLIGVAVLVVAAGTAAFLYRDQIGMMIAFGRLEPEMTFAEAPPPESFTFPKVQVPVLMFHGLEDQALLPGALNGTWQWVEKDLTIMTVPGANHFVQQDAPELVSNTMVDWLKRRQ